MTQLSDRAEQCRSKLEKQSASRAAQIESLLTAGDYDAAREWINEWEQEDKDPDSLFQRYREVRSELRQQRYRERQHQLYGSVIEKITARGGR